MPRLRLIHWNEAEAADRAARLRAAGFGVDYESPGAGTLRKIREEPPSAVLVDLSRLPMQGRDMGLALRKGAATRRLPLVFVDGSPEKVERVRRQLPDAEYTSWSRIRSALKRALEQPPVDPVVPASVMDGYSGTPLPKKLRIKPDTVVALVGAPEGFEETLGELPAGVALRRSSRGRPDLTIWFPRSRRDLERRIERLGELAGRGGLWIAWPKKAARVPTDLSQTLVRGAGLAAGLVDYKICSIDATWSGLLFARRRGR
jgi:hypothetical protein